MCIYIYICVHIFRLICLHSYIYIYICIYIDAPVHKCTYIHTYMCIYTSVNGSLSLLTDLFIYLSICLFSGHLATCPSIHLPIDLSIYLFVYLLPPPKKYILFCCVLPRLLVSGVSNVDTLRFGGRRTFASWEIQDFAIASLT